MFPSDYRRIARENLAGNWAISVGVAFVAALLGGLYNSNGIDLDIDAENLRYISTLPWGEVLLKMLWGSTVINFVHFILGGPVSLGYCTYLLNQHDRTQPLMKDLFSHFDRFGAGFCLKLLTALYTALWSLLLVIPGIVAYYRYAMAPFILAENPELTASEAITASKEMMDGHKWDLFFLDLSFIGWGLLCALTLGLGTLWLNPYTHASRAAFYRDISRT